MSPSPIWFIERTGFGVPGDLQPVPEIDAESVIEYAISDFSKYMLNPDPLEVRKRLVGCEIHRRKPRRPFWQSRFLRWTPWYREPDDIPPDILLAQSPIPPAPSRDIKFHEHLDQINDALRPFDPFPKRIRKLDLDRVEDIVGICEDVDGNQSVLNLEGDLDSKAKYMIHHFSRSVNVILENRQLSPGLFEMRGFDFPSFNPDNRYRLIRFYSKGKSKACVMDAENMVQFWVKDLNTIRYLLLLEQSVRENEQFRNAFLKCISGEYLPMKILINNNFEIGYTDTYLPGVYRDLVRACNLDVDEKGVIVKSLNQLQLGVAFSYLVKDSSGKQKLYTRISVMHNVKALETIRQRIPKLYSEINKRISVSEFRKFYLLDTIGGYMYA